MRRGFAVLLVAGTMTTAYVGAGSASAASGSGFAPYQVVDPATDVMSVGVADVTGDGLPDLVTTAYTDPRDGTGREIRVYAQQDGGTLSHDPVRIPVGSSDKNDAMNGTLSDLDGDGHLELLVTTYDGVQVFRQAGGGLEYVRTIAVPQAYDVATADVTDDGAVDLVVTAADGLHVLTQQGGSFVDAHLSTDPTFAIAAGDVTGDGLPDVLQSTAGGFEVYAQQPGGFATPVSYPSGLPGDAYARAITIGDTDGDGLAEVHVSGGTDPSQARVVTWAQDAAHTLFLLATRATQANPGAIVLADVAGDGHPDLVVAHGQEEPDLRYSTVGVYESTPGAAPAETSYTVPGQGSFGHDTGQLAVGDLNSDGLPDIVSMSSFYGVSVLNGQGASTPPADTTPPETTISSGPSGTSYSHTATFSFGADEQGSTFACSLDGAAPAACTSPQTYDGLAAGTHTFAVTATDSSRNQDPTPATAAFTVTPSADLSVSLTAAPGSVKKGSVLTWTSTVGNGGPDPAQSVTFTETVPAGLGSVVASRSDGTSCTVTSATVTCQRPALAAGTTWVITMSGTVLGNKGTVSSSAQVSSATHELSTGDDSSQVVTVKVGNGNGN